MMIVNGSPVCNLCNLLNGVLLQEPKMFGLNTNCCLQFKNHEIIFVFSKKNRIKCLCFFTSCQVWLTLIQKGRNFLNAYNWILNTKYVYIDIHRQNSYKNYLTDRMGFKRWILWNRTIVFQIFHARIPLKI